MIIFDEIKFKPTYKYTEYASVIEYECRCGDSIKITGSESYCDEKRKEFIEEHKKC